MGLENTVNGYPDVLPPARGSLDRLLRRWEKKYPFRKRLELTTGRNGQSCWAFCPTCQNDLISSESLVVDDPLVTYVCTICQRRSYWDFDSYPLPVLVS